MTIFARLSQSAPNHPIFVIVPAIHVPAKAKAKLAWRHWGRENYRAELSSLGEFPMVGPNVPNDSYAVIEFGDLGKVTKLYRVSDEFVQRKSLEELDQILDSIK